MADIPTKTPGIQYPNIRNDTTPGVDDAMRNAFDNLYYLRGQVTSLIEQVRVLAERVRVLESR